MKKVIYSESNRDLVLKFMCKILFRLNGYNTHYEVKLRTKSYIDSFKTHDISDIDVLAIDFSKDLNYFTIGSECKSGETGALDEVYKLIGVSQSVKLDRSYFIKSKIHQNARQIAAHNNIKCYSDAELRKLLSGFELELDKEINIERAKYSKIEQSFKILSKYNPKIVDYVTYEYWNKEDWRNIHNMVHILSLNQTSDLLLNQNPIDKLAYYYIVELLSISVLKTTAQAIVINYSDITSAVRTSLYGGSESLNERRKLFDLVGQVTKGKQDFSPEWESDLVNIGSRIALNTRSASFIPLLLQDIRENSFYNDKIDIKPDTIQRYPDGTRKFIQDIVQFVTKSTGVSIEIFAEIMKI